MRHHRSAGRREPERHPGLLAIASVLLLVACPSEGPVYRPDPDPGPPPVTNTRPSPAAGRPGLSKAAATATATAPVSPQPPAPGKAARGAWAARCAACHGPKGLGDGPAARMIRPAPRSLADPAWQASVTDELLRDIIVRGGAAVGRSPSMPPSPDLAGQPQILDGLVGLIRSFKM